MSLALDFDVLRELTAAPGLPGREAPVADLIRRKMPTGWELESDPLGNLVAHRPGPGARLMFMAHMDEVGLIVQRITPQGFLKVDRLGGMGLRSLPGSRLTLWSDMGPLNAQVGVLPQHLENRQYLELTDLYVDIGAGSADEARRMGVQVGDGLTWRAHFERLGETCFSSKALDDRLGCFALLSLAARELDTQADVCLAFVAQEETILAGGLPAVEKYRPDVLVGVDGTLTFDTPDTLNSQCELVLGGGPALKWMDAIRGKNAAFVPDRGLVQRVRTLAKSVGISLQDEVVSGISTALAPLTYTAGGVRSVALSLPVRYHHSPAELADRRDVESLVNLLEKMVGEEWPVVRGD